MAYPVDALAGHMSQMSMQPTPRAGETALLALFGEGNIIFLQSAVTRQNLRIYDGEVQGTGGNEMFAQFVVHLRRPGVVAFQSLQNSLDWLAIYEGRVIGTGRGGPFCEFFVKEFDGKFVLLESTQYPNQLVGLFPDGRVKPPNEVTPDEGRFVPVVHQYANRFPEGSGPPQQSLPPPQGGYGQPLPVAYGPPPGAYGHPPQGPPPGAYGQPPQGPPPGAYGQPPQGPPPGAYSQPPQGPPPGAYGQPPQAPPYGQPPQAPPYGQTPQAPPYGQTPQAPPYGQTPQAPPPGRYGQPGQSFGPPQEGAPPSVLPSGFLVTDAFRPGNIVQLIARANGNPLCIARGDVFAGGQYGVADSQWTVSIAANNGIILQNVHWPGLYISIRGKTITAKGKNDKHCHFKVHVLPDNYVYFESINQPDTFLGFQSDGNPRKPREVKPAEGDAQFFVRVERQKHPFSAPIVTPYGRPSIFAMLVDQAVVQFFINGQERYLSIDRSGNVKTISNPNDDTSFLIWKDRGMGIVSLQSYLFPGYRVRMAGFTVSGKGDADLNSDFRVKENIDNTITLESVTCPGGVLGIDMKGQVGSRLSVNLVTIQKYGKSNTVTKSRIL